MKKLELLIVEDSPEMINSYRRDIKSFKLSSDVKIDEIMIDNKAQAIEILKDRNKFFDAAIVDLKLDSKGEPDKNYSGNEVLGKLRGI